MSANDRPLRVKDEEDAGPPVIGVDGGAGTTGKPPDAAPHAVLGVAPAHGPASGGTLALIRGNGFASDARVWFGDVKLEADAVVAVDAERIQVTVPPGSAGAVDVIVQNGEDQSTRGTLTGGYTYDRFFGMELSIPWTIARPVADQPPARRSQGLTSDDPDLVGRAREGDQVAFARLFEQYHAPILNYLHRMVGDRAMAEDLTQDTFIKAYNALPSTRPDLAFKPWLYRIATNTAISQLRRRKIVQWIPFLPGHDHASDQSIERSVGRRQDIEQTLSRLPQHYAAALLLRHYQGMSLAETADALGITENAAKLRLFRARKAFAEIYGSAEALGAPEKWEARG